MIDHQGGQVSIGPHNHTSSFISVMSGSRVTSLLMVSARVFLIPLTYSKLRVYFDASSTPQLLTLSFLVFLSKNDFNGR